LLLLLPPFSFALDALFCALAHLLAAVPAALSAPAPAVIAAAELPR
jgi:hypothetical protein